MDLYSLTLWRIAAMLLLAAAFVVATCAVTHDGRIIGRLALGFGAALLAAVTLLY
jgi:hypothetical protein